MIQERLKSLGVGWVELIGMVTSFLFITGVSYYYGYYEAGLNSDWIINLLTTKELLISNIRLGAGVILALMYFEALFDKQSPISPKKVLIIGNSALITLLIFWAIFKETNTIWESLSYLAVFNALYGIIYYKFLGKMICVSLILFVAPFINGVVAFNKKINSNLPIVTLKEDKTHWYLFDTFSDQAILIDSLKKEKNIKIVAVNELDNIRVK
ncbi:hypothetical protein H0920_10805 [Acinetobacter sp. C_4_1]|uniref:hypothetical protein n=1 Tax=unclassified Acinetobacter TaxID=196816 RepID=UPI0021B800C3|nr:MULTISPECIES: hypothetical protein [unclassified Acinetobacter]MCT8090683.1 hypothetical protein [Acinetobacter sp. F_3_1]MCT8101585.1 hypothetical protein [Acinetobacter sp. C_4_1]MCT8135080.1 hypothetical protein [Acinetobacter sp. T_3_1]